MKNYTPYFFCSVFIVAFMFQCSDKVSLIEEVATEKEKVKGLEKEISGLKDNIKLLDEEKKQLNDEVNSLNQEIEKSKSQIKTIKNERNKKINAISNYSSDQLQRFFSVRYGNIK